MLVPVANILGGAGARHMIVTGASSGVGAAVARKLAAAAVRDGRPLHLYLCGRKEENLLEVSDACRANVPFDLLDVRCALGDVKSKKDVQRMWEEFECPTVDVLVANAGINRPGPVHKVTEEEYDDVMDTNVKGVFNWLQQVVPVMKQNGSGQIVVTNSVLGLKSSANSGLYCASKFALEGLVGSLREEARGYGVKVAQVYPAGIDTPWWDEPERGGVRPTKPDTSKFLQANDVAEAILTLVNQTPNSDIERLVLRPHSKM